MEFPFVLISLTSGGRFEERVKHGARGRPVDVPVPMKKHCRWLSDILTCVYCNDRYRVIKVVDR